MPNNLPIVSREQVIRLWLSRQGLIDRPGTERLERDSFVSHLENTGGLQIDSVNVLDRAHYLTLWSRFGSYRRTDVDRWVYRDKLAFEYWAHEASLLPTSNLPLARRRMRRFPPPSWKNRAWWQRFSTSPASKRRVIEIIKERGPIERAALSLEEDKRSLKLLWHSGRLAVVDRRHFRCVYDLAERWYPEGPTASPADYQDSWLLTGLSGSGIAPARHLVNYLTAPSLTAAERNRVIARNLRSGRIQEVQVAGLGRGWYVKPKYLETIQALPEPSATYILCPFDSFLWQRKRAEELLGFRYRIEIYVPASKRQYGYYVMPILHGGRLVGRLDPKLHRDRSTLEIRNLQLEPDFDITHDFRTELRDRIEDLARFTHASEIQMPNENPIR